ncbi:hypothetical protein N7478_013106 [Penicillium angulare]|uniref:uncharacterized protein n=1 Tax=Penicillium angulare TaxID=116970 RepID=UPI0025410BFB|nr:uncharacterized protein N7478_013106 [Penicillium angulare]KAJ5257002.1 hypothetical protein N7478_013106 [Penicillium angulare]
MDATLYLAENVLNERNPVTYRSLSRALKVNANRAKQVLYEFHRNENAKEPQSVRATYVISGIQKPRGAAPGTDEVMQKHPRIRKSTPNQTSTTLIPYTTSILLAREEELNDAKATFLSISTIHVYSLQSAILQDLDVLVDVTKEALAAHSQDDPLECGKQWGMIQNKHVMRRTGAGPPPPAASAPKTETKFVPKVKPEPTVPAKRLFQKENPAKEESGASDSKPAPSSANDSDAPSKSAKPAPKHAKGSLFSSFAKAKPKTKATPAPDTATSTPGEDIVLNDASDGEEQAELFPESSEKPASAIRETKKAREEKLKQMMEDDADDEEMPDADDEEPEEPEREPTPVEQPPVAKPVELKEEVTVQGGRRRGKRQIMKKRTVKDDEGYLVTREEPTWESFSEDEPAPPKKKPTVNVPIRKGAKPGQGNIMSFFGKQ